MRAPVSGQSSAVGAGVLAATTGSPVSGPFSGLPSSDSKYYSLVVYMVFKPKPWSGRLRQQIFVHVGCRQIIAHPGVAKVVAIAPILPRYRHVKYCGAFLGIK